MTNELPSIPAYLNGVLFMTPQGEIGLLVRREISTSEMVALYGKLMELTAKE